MTPDPQARWLAMLGYLSGDPPPPPPALPGRQHLAERDTERQPSLADELRQRAGWIRPGMRGPRP